MKARGSRLRRQGVQVESTVILSHNQNLKADAFQDRVKLCIYRPHLGLCRWRSSARGRGSRQSRSSQPSTLTVRRVPAHTPPAHPPDPPAVSLQMPANPLSKTPSPSYSIPFPLRCFNIFSSHTVFIHTQSECALFGSHAKRNTVLQTEK